MSIHDTSLTRPRVNREVINDRSKLIKHRLIAREIARRPQVIQDIMQSLPLPEVGEPLYMQEWRDLLNQGPNRVRERIVSRDEQMTRLRVSSPLSFVVDFTDTNLRRRISRKAKMIESPTL